VPSLLWTLHEIFDSTDLKSFIQLLLQWCC